MLSFHRVKGPFLFVPDIGVSPEDKNKILLLSNSAIHRLALIIRHIASYNPTSHSQNHRITEW